MEMRSVLLFKLVKRYVFVPFISLLSFLIANAYANDEDTQLRLEQQLQRNAVQKEQKLLEDEIAQEAKNSRLTINGNTFHVGDNVDELGRALYLAVQHKIWPAVKAFLPRYLSHVTHDLMLVLYAEGGLARHAGNFELAESKYRQLLLLKPDFLLAQLELARVLFENQKNNDALALFNKIQNQIPKNAPQTQGVLKTIETFNAALAFRDSWQGSIAIGGSYNNNINQSSESSLCLARLPSGTCFIQRNTPKAIEGTGLEFEASVNKRFSLAGHHGLIFRSLLFGNVYHNHTQFNENTLTSKFGYSYQNAKNQIFVSPLFEHKGLANETLYNAWGASAEWLNILSPQRALKIETNIKQQEYQKRGLRFQNGIEVSAFITFWNQFNNGWFVFAGADYLQKNSRNKVFSMNQPGVRFGVSKPLFDGIDATLFTSFRERRFAEYNAILRKKRLDYEQNYTLVVNAERFAVMGISPSLTVRYSHINSKVDWLFTHDKTTVSLKFNRKF